MSRTCPTPETLDQMWRCKLSEAERGYSENRTGENRAEYLRVLSIFAALVTRGVTPTDDDFAGRARP